MDGCGIQLAFQRAVGFAYLLKDVNRNAKPAKDNGPLIAVAWNTAHLNANSVHVPKQVAFGCVLAEAFLREPVAFKLQTTAAGIARITLSASSGAF